MLATLAGFLALLLGLSLLLLPLLVSELSRPRDSAWGAVVLLLGLVLVTSAERLTGAPMLAVLCGGLLVGRLGSEVAQARWIALSDEERQALRSSERWSRSFNQLAAVAASLLQSAVGVAAGASAWLAERRQGRSHGKRWVRTEAPSASSSAAPDAGATPQAGAGGQAKAAATGMPVELAADQLGRDAAASPLGAPLQIAASPDSDLAQDRAGREPPQPVAAATELDLVSADQPQEASFAAAADDPGVRIVADFDGVDALLAAAPEPGAPAVAPPPAPVAEPNEPSTQPGA